MDPITPFHLLHGRSTISLLYQDVHNDKVDDRTYGNDTDLRKIIKSQALLFKHFCQEECLTVLQESHHLISNNTQIIGVGDFVLIHNDIQRVTECLNKGNDGLIPLEYPLAELIDLWLSSTPWQQRDLQFNPNLPVRTQMCIQLCQDQSGVGLQRGDRS